MALAGEVAELAARIGQEIKAVYAQLAGKAASSHSHGIGDLPVATSGTSSTSAVVRADDSRLSNSRTPTAHTHAIGDLPVAVSGTSSTTAVVRADDSRLSNARTPTTHTHAIADLPVATSGTSSSTQVVRADDSRLSNARTPTTHTHAIGDLPVAPSGTKNTTQLVRADDSRLSDHVAEWVLTADTAFPSGDTNLGAAHCTEVVDTANAFTNGVYTVPQTGRYELFFRITTNVSTGIELHVLRNGTSVVANSLSQSGSHTGVGAILYDSVVLTQGNTLLFSIFLTGPATVFRTRLGGITTKGVIRWIGPT